MSDLTSNGIVSRDRGDAAGVVGSAIPGPRDWALYLRLTFRFCAVLLRCSVSSFALS